jgi:quercetin dioxygenase-like cupin family protein
MKVIRQLLNQEGWRLGEAGMPIQVGVKSGATPFGKQHLHKTMAEYFLLLAGELRLKVSGETLDLARGDLVVVEPGEAHEVVRASPDSLLLLLMPPDVPNDKVELAEQTRQKAKVKRQK